MPRNPESKAARLSGVSLPKPSSSVKLHFSFLIHKYTPPWKCFDSHQDQVYQLIQLAVTRLLFTAVTWLKRKQSHHMLLESSDKSQAGLMFPLFLAVFVLSPGNQVLGSRLSSSSLFSKEPATKFSCNQESPQYWNVLCWWIDSVDRWTIAKESTKDHLAGARGWLYTNLHWQGSVQSRFCSSITKF